MVYDAARGRVVLYGGQDLDDIASPDLWEYDGTQWSAVSVPLEPPARSSAALACDWGRGRAVLFGGSYGAQLLDDTWEFDGAQWLAVTGDATPAARLGHALSYDPGGERVLLYGGADTMYGDGMKGDLWTYDGLGWQQVTDAAAPGRRGGMGMTFHREWGTTVLFGGALLGPWSLSTPGDLWELDGLQWRRVAADVPSGLGRIYHGFAYDPSRDALAAVGGVMPLGMATYSIRGDQWEFREGAWFRVGENEEPMTLNGAVLHYNVARGRLTQYGGDSPEGSVGNTWEWDGVSWRELAPAVQPPPSLYPAGCYDVRRRVLIVVGGSDLTETWEFAYQSAHPDEDCLDALGADEDEDGLVNCDDPDCNQVPECAPEERCVAGSTEDRDGDGLIGCADPNCGGAPCGPDGLVCLAGRCCKPGEYIEGDCGNGADDDCDGLIDCQDPDCAGTAACP